MPGGDWVASISATPARGLWIVPPNPRATLLPREAILPAAMRLRRAHAGKRGSLRLRTAWRSVTFATLVV